jgi:catechol 2,3-dioxygenase-like lactoylglutathione lyase family enzyme
MLRNTRALAIVLAGAVCAFGQTRAPSAAAVGVLGFNHIVNNVERSVEFYRDVIGLGMTEAPKPFAAIPWNMDMGNTPGAQSRSALLYIPGSTPLILGLTEYRDIDRKAAHPRFQDPGAASLILWVRDMDAMMAKLKGAHAHINSLGGEPGVIPGPNGTHTRVVFVQDPDGFFIEIAERNPTPETTAPYSSNVIGGGLEVIVADLGQTLRIYRDILGFDTSKPTEWDGTKLMMDTAGTPGGQFRRSAATVPVANGTSVTVAFMEFKAIDRRPLHTRVQDPGTAIWLVSVRDIDATVSALQAAGVTVISKNRGSVMLNGPPKPCILRDPNNLYLELVQLLDLGRL